MIASIFLKFYLLLNNVEGNGGSYGFELDIHIKKDDIFDFGT